LKIAFWLLAAAVAWTYLLFPVGVLLRGAARRAPRFAPLPAGSEPTVSVVLAARNEAERLERRIENLLAQDYPRERLQVVVVCNTCTDDSAGVARTVAQRDSRVEVLVSDADQGKAGALNLGVGHARGEIVVFADARQLFAPDAVRRLVEAFADPSVGAVSGRLVIGPSRKAAVRGMGIYWWLETHFRAAQSRTGSVIGATGAIYAVRRALVPRVPPHLILDDVFIPMQVVLRGFRVLLRPEAVAHDTPSGRTRLEYRRKLRTMTGNVQLLRALPDLLSARRNPFFVRYLSHKVMRVLTPLLLVLLAALGALLPLWPYRASAATVAGLAVLGVVGLLLPLRLLALPAAFVVVQWAALVALLRPGRDASAVWTAPEPARERPVSVP
jgi:poly-beta-1,6-N-acetyl-D-glucosamine synthase